MTKKVFECEEILKLECVWDQDNDGVWETTCNQMFVFNDDGPIANKFKWCPFCGWKLVEEPHP
jgi:hypothetical protein